jgi:uncharacterized protein Yka (UPF0111/DUF47 family)
LVLRILPRILPPRYDFFADLDGAAANALAAADLLIALLTSGEDVLVHQLRDLEHRGDDITHGIFGAIGKSFISELGPREIRALAKGMDDFVDDIEEAGRRYHLYQMGPATPAAQQLASLIRSQAEVLNRVMLSLSRSDQDEAIMEYTIEIHRLENEADELFSQSLATLYDNAADVPAVIRAKQWGEIYGLLERATDRAEGVAHIVEGIVGQRL